MDSAINFKRDHHIRKGMTKMHLNMVLQRMLILEVKTKNILRKEEYIRMKEEAIRLTKERTGTQKTNIKRGDKEVGAGLKTEIEGRTILQDYKIKPIKTMRKKEK